MKGWVDNATEKTFRDLRRFNGAMAVLHLAQGVAIILLSSDFTLPLRQTFLDADPFEEGGSTLTTTIFNIRLGPLIGTFLLISAVAHFLLSTVLYRWYVANLKRHINYLRWWEYAFSSSLMIVVIGLLTGILDLPTLVLMFSINAVMIFCGLIMEIQNQSTERANWTSFYVGCFAGIVPWVIIAWYFGGIWVNSDGEVPSFVIGIMISLFVLFNIFAANMVLQYRQIGRWRDYLFGEKMYVVLSLTAKSVLAWWVFFGTLR